MIAFLQKNKTAGYIFFVLASFVTYIIFNNLLTFLARVITGQSPSFYFFVSSNLCLATLKDFQYTNTYLVYHEVMMILKFGMAITLIQLLKKNWLLLYFSIGLLWYDLFSILGFYCISVGSGPDIFNYGFSAVPLIVASKNISHSFYILPLLSTGISVFYLIKYLPGWKNIAPFIVLSFISIIFTAFTLNMLYSF